MDKYGSSPLPEGRPLDLWQGLRISILFGTIGTLKYDDNPSAKVRPENKGLLQLAKGVTTFYQI